MAKAIAARTQGDDYQARWFWYEVCRLFLDNTHVDRVVYEHENIKSLDDVAVYYRDGMIDEHGHPLRADYYQVKFHVTAAGAFTWQGMMDPAFINATSVSLLQRLCSAQQAYAPDGTGCRFILFTPWTIDANDPLAEIVTLAHGHIDWARLAEGGPRSATGTIRAAWRAHLGLATDEELRRVLQPLRIERGPTLAKLGGDLNYALQAAGLRPVEDGCLVHPYDDLTRKLLQRGETSFTRADIEHICRRERLWRGYASPEAACHIGVRSFLRWTEHLEDETDALLSLLPYFEGRYIKSDDLWDSDVFPALAQFLEATLRGQRRCYLHLHAHATIAFAAGYCLDSKSGVEVIPVQSTPTGREIWNPVPQQPADAYPGWEVEEILLAEDGTDVVVALGVTTDIRNDVRHFVAQQLPHVRRILFFRPGRAATNTAVLDGAHARLLAHGLSTYLKTNRTTEERQHQLHLFAAAPNGLLFFLGQVARSLGSCLLYEYDFDHGAPGAYRISLAFPPRR
jgi:SMODS-associated and fused to various effectors sensor domain